MRAQYERMMSAMGNMSEEELADMFPETEELVVNTDSPLTTKLEALESGRYVPDQDGSRS